MSDRAATASIEKSLLYSSPSSNLNLWDDSTATAAGTVLPRWMKDYFTWHHQQRQLLVQNISHWDQFRYLILQCREHDGRCGGAADRLKPIPYLLLIAAQTQRLLFIVWQRPHALEEFLLPPHGGVDWRIPSFLPRKLWKKHHNRPSGSHQSIVKHIQQHPNAIALCTKYQAFHGGEDYYNEQRRRRRRTKESPRRSHRHIHGVNNSNDNYDDDEEEPTFAQVYPHVWKILFTPSPPIAQLISQHLLQLQLVPHSYVAAHIRSSYGKLGQPQYHVALQQYVDRWSMASIQCASQLLPKAPILVVSDSILAMNKTLEYATSHASGIPQTRVVARMAFTPASSNLSHMTNASLGWRAAQPPPPPVMKQPLHLDKTEGWQQRPASDYYDTFVDLYLMAMARCVVYNVGGFGHWAMLIGSSSALPWSKNVTDAASSITCGLQYFDSELGFHECGQPTAELINPSGGNDDGNSKDGSTSTTTATKPNWLQNFSGHIMPEQSPEFVIAGPLFFPPIIMDNNSVSNQQATRRSVDSRFVPRYFPRPLGNATLVLQADRQEEDTVIGLSETSSWTEGVAKNGHPASSQATATRHSPTDHLINHTTTTYSRGSRDILPWEKSTILPDWIKQYFRWHREQRQRITMDNWRNFKYIVVRCRKSRRCGGTADRLKPIPFFVLIAFQTNRLLMINWERPKPLEDFLVPPIHGIDWRVPDFLVWNIARDNYPKNTLDKIVRAMNDTTAISFSVRYQSINSGSEYFDQTRPHGPTFAEVYHDLWHAVFTPTPPIAKRIEDLMNKLGLVPGQYVAAHVRSNYSVDAAERDDIEGWTKNSINCASQLMPSATTFVASDSSQAIEVAKAYGHERNAHVVARAHDNPPLHLEKALDWETRPASDYYDTFVDLYLLGMSRCVTYNQGGFGSWASLISFNSSCSLQHHYTNGIMENCEWKTSQTAQKSPSFPVTSAAPQPLFAEPMPYPNLWDSAATIPKWMKDYFAWHANELTNLNPPTWTEHRYMIVVCLTEHLQCGGVSDRLKPLPLFLLIARRTNRILMIWWERPNDLEEFLEPPKGGLDWRVPAWLRPLVRDRFRMATSLESMLAAAPEPLPVLQVLYQSGNSGSVYFNSTGDAETNYEKVFHELFRIVFTPSPALAEVITETMKRNKLIAGEYASAHLRAMYGRTSRDTEEIKYLAVNGALCASRLRPGGPVYFAGDSKLAVDAVRNFSQKHSLPIATFEYEGEALHLDKDDRNTTTSFKPVDFFPTFVDLYLIAQSNCVTYSNGGFGTFGLALSYNSSCALQHFRRRRPTQHCRWQSAKRGFESKRLRTGRVT